jgi:hypothetical protein
MAETKPLNWWIKSTQNVHAVLKPHVERYNELNGKKILGTIHVTVAKRLKTSGLLSSITTPSNDVILNEFNKYVSELEVVESEHVPVSELIEAPKPTEDELVSLLNKLLKDSDKELIIRRRRTCCLW